MRTQPLGGSPVFLVTLLSFCACGANLGAGHDDSTLLEFDNGLSIEVVEEGGLFLGLGSFVLDGRALRPSEPYVFPLVAADWSYPEGLFTRLRVQDIRPVENGWELVISLQEAGDEDAWKEFFLLGDDGLLLRDRFLFARSSPDFPHHPMSLGDGRASGSSGQIVWRIEAVEETVAGWTWRGWRWSFSGALLDALPLNAMRLISGWALDGNIDGLTIANQRYRGLGYPAQKLEDHGSGCTSAWNTMDVLIPRKWSGRSAEMDRETALSTRTESWIHSPARGAGTGFIDYQFRESAALVSFHEKQGNLRGLIEIYPGDHVPKQLDEYFFSATGEFETVPQRFLCMVLEEGESDEFWRTRYLELEQRVRTAVAEELGFIETPVVPTVGALFDFWRPGDGFAQVVARLGSHAGRWSELGVRRIMVHNPGWKNGRAAKNEWDGATREDYIGGSVNTVYDWLPLPDVETAWRHSHAALKQLGIEYYIWLCGMVYHDAGFHNFVGKDPAFWASNAPDGRSAAFYGDAVEHNILSEEFKEAFNSRLQSVRASYGYEGFWADSFQNLWMSQLDWIGHKGASQQRTWWEWIAARTREGLGWIGESQSFPGLNCSIETEGWERHPWLLGHTIKWLRGTHQLQRSADGWTPLAYRLMAYNAWLAPETWLYEVTEETQPDAVIGDFGRLANEFLAAKPFMDRPYELDDGRGVLWVSSDNDQEGVLFPFKRHRLPEDVSASPAVAASAGSSKWQTPEHTLFLQGENLLQSFGVRIPPGTDERSNASALNRDDVASTYGPEHPPVLEYHPIPGKVSVPAWNSESEIWKKDAYGPSVPWPDGGLSRAFFPAKRKALLPVEGRVEAAGVQTVAPGVEFLIDTTSQRDGVGDLLELSGPLLGPARIYFKGTEKGGGGPHTPSRARTGLQFRGGGVYDLEADLLPWPEERHRHSQIVGLEDPGTTVHYRGHWDATGELCRPGIALGDETRFVIWPEARMSFIKDYGGFTLQLWVTATGDRGNGVLELHPEFVADRSRVQVSSLDPRGRDLVPEALGSIRMGGATLITHDSKNLPITGRSLGDENDTIQNNGHLVFEYRDSNRWIIRTRDQVYRGAVWIDDDVTIVTEKNLLLEGITEPPDQFFHYTAANAFQTRRKKGADPKQITICKEGSAALILGGEQAYVEGSVLSVADGSVEFRTNPAAGRTYPRGEEQDGVHLELVVAEKAAVVWSCAEARIRRLVAESGSRLVWEKATVVKVDHPVVLHGQPVWSGGRLEDPVVLLAAPAIELQSDLPEGWRLRPSDGGVEIVFFYSEGEE